MKPLRDAQREIMAGLPVLESIDVPLAAAAGLVLAEPIAAPHDVPPFPNSAMDGYAVRAGDLVTVPAELRVIADLPAGDIASEPVESGTAIKIMTGAPLPPGADTVVQVEHTVPAGSSVRILRSHPAGTAVRRAGEDMAQGDVVLEPGLRLDATRLGVLATLGITDVPVRRARVAVMSTGDELVSPAEPEPAPGKIRDSNRVVLAELLRDVGAEVLDYGIVGDDHRRLRAALLDAADEADAVLSSGGVSMGDYDLVKQVLGELGGVEVWKVAMKPGKPSAFGRIAGKPFFGLPGNPVSVFVAFEQFVRPAILSMTGASRHFRPRLPGVMASAVRSTEEREEFVRVTTEQVAGEWTARPSGGQGSHVLSALAAADAFAVIPSGVAQVDAGAVVELEMFRWPEARTATEVLGE